MSHVADTPAQPIAFTRNAREALADAQLRRNFRGAMDALMDKRRNQFPDGDELERLRAFGNRVRARVFALTVRATRLGAGRYLLGARIEREWPLPLGELRSEAAV